MVTSGMGVNDVKRIIAVVLLFAVVLTFAGCGVKDTKDKVFTCEEMSITLNEGYTETEMEGYTACFDSATVAVFIIKEEFSLMVGFEDYTLEQYADLVMQANSARTPERADTDELTCMKYSYFNSEENQNYIYLASLYKSDNAFWMVQFVCKEEDYAEHEAYFIERAKTVQFS